MDGPWRLSLGLLLALSFFSHFGALSGVRVWDDWEVLEAGAADPTVSWEARPLRALTLRWDRWAWGEDPRGGRLTNLLLHGACAVGIWSLTRTLGGTWQGALVAGAAYGVHPVLCEVVASVANRKESLLVLGTLLTVIVFLRSQGRRAWLGASLLFFLLAALAKETAVVVPLLLLVCDRARAGSWREIRWGAHLPFWALAAMAFWIFFLRVTGADPAGRIVRIDLFGYTRWELFSAAGAGFWDSAALLAIPAGLCADHPMPSGGIGGVWGTALLALSVVAAACVWGRSRGTAGWGLPAAWLWMVAGWIPTAVFLNPASFPVAERYWALPWAGGALWCGWVFERLAGRCRLAAPAVVVILLAWVAASARHDRRWLENHRLATAAIIENPRSWMAHIDRANREAGIPGRKGLVRAQFERAARIQPLAGHVDYFWGRWDLAEERFDLATERFLAACRKGFESTELFVCGVDAAVRSGSAARAIFWLDAATRSGRSRERLERCLSERTALWEPGAAAEAVARWRRENNEKVSVPR